MKAKTLLAGALAVAGSAATACGLALNSAAGQHGTELFPGPSAVFAALAAPVGAYLLARKRGSLAARLLLAGGCCLAAYVLAMGMSAQGIHQAALARTETSPWVPWSVWFSSWAWMGGLAITAFLPQVFPTGKLVPSACGAPPGG